MQKHLLVPSRVRRVPRQFSWIDQRLVRDNHIAPCHVEALALYLLLVTVADAQGLSYYGDRSIARLLSLSSEPLIRARETLISAGLIAYEAPLYQVLALNATPPTTTPTKVRQRRGAEELRSLREILRHSSGAHR